MAHPLLQHLKYPKEEYTLIDVESVKEPEICVCGHYPITNVATIKHYSGDVERIGTVCMKLFNETAQQIVDDVRRGYYTDVTLAWCLDVGVVSEWECAFYKDTRRKRKLSEKQTIILLRIIGKIEKRFPKISR